MRKRNLKKKIAFLLALSMVYSFPQAISAEAVLSSIGEFQLNSAAVLSKDGNPDTLPENLTDMTENNAVSLQAEDSTSFSNIEEFQLNSVDVPFEDSNPYTLPENLTDMTENNAVSLQSEESVASSTDTGKIEVIINEGMVFENSIDFEVTLQSGEDTQQSTLTLSRETRENGTNKAEFEYLANGEYVLEVSAPGFAVYRQVITVNKDLYAVNLTVGFYHNGYTYAEDTLHPGVVMIGDINQDGVVDDADKDILIDAIDNGGLSTEYYTDLNYDGKTNLMDLVFLSNSYNEEDKDIMAQIEEFVSPANVTAELEDGTTIEAGSLEDLLQHESPVTLSPADPDAPISEENPVVVGFEFAEDEEKELPVMDALIMQSGSTPVSSAKISLTYIEDGEEKTVEVEAIEDVDFLLEESKIVAKIDQNGNISIDLKGQVAVKKVTLAITGLQQKQLADGNEAPNLAEISKVEFVNGMEKRIPEAATDSPEGLTAKAGSEKFDLTWDPCINVTGYEVQIKQDDKVIQTLDTTSTSIQVSGDDIKNFITYTVSVQSVNGNWRSGYCDPIEVTPKATKRPDKPDNVKATGTYRGIKVSWAKMDDTQSFTVFYKLRDSDEEYTAIPDITGTSYTIDGLEDLTEYEVYVIGVNELGESPESLHTAASTTNLDLAEMPRYNLINRDENGVPGSAHIVSVTRNGGEMIDSTLDAAEEADNTAWGAVDGDPASYYSKSTWDDGGFNGIGNNGLTYTFDQEYTLDTIGILTVNTDISYTNVRCWDAEGNLVYELNDGYGNLSSSKTDADGKQYYMLKLPKAVTASKIQICLARYLTSPITISETYFYHYDTLMDEVMNLYVDDLHTVLKDNVTQKTVDALREKINTPDEFGEENPNAEALLRELETAETILNAKFISNAVEIHTCITTKDIEVNRGFSGLNAWQPLGVSIGTGEEVTIYVGSNQKKTGDSTNLRLIVTQYHSESGNVVLEGANLKVGANTFKLSKGSGVGAENGGALYIQYQGASDTSERFSVRVTGGSEVPFLDLYQVTDEEERMEKAVAYINKLDEYVPKIEELHNAVHKGSENKNIDYDYDSQNCILGASDIMMDTMMYSLPAQQLLAGMGSGTAEKRAETLLKSVDAMEDMMYLFYQHKGLNADAPTQLNRVPKAHLNIRYQRMFSGAFMYASGNHIGIEWGSAPSMVNCTGVTFDENGQYVSGNYFGWGIAHEIGHDINQGSYAVAEITNNYFSQLAQAQDKNEGMRFQYQNIYDKVTSGTKGDCSNIATQLGMYWQLHLAYDKGLNFKTYSDYEEQLANIFYARVDTYSRDTSAAPAPADIALTLGSDSDQNLMRLACAAAEKNVLEFFERWGKQPDPTTVAYAEQFDKETRAIMYANDDSRVYALNGKGSILGTEGKVSAIENVSVTAGTGMKANEVKLAFTSTDIPEADILGYEIIRCTISGGKIQRTPVGFATGSDFTDTVTTLNNRVVFYEVTLIDQYLNRSAVFVTDHVKIMHDGSMDKTNWTITTTGLTAEAITHDATDDMPCDTTKEDPAELAIDHDTTTAYEPQVDADQAEIILDFNQTLTAAGLKYTAGDGESIGDYKIYVLQDEVETTEETEEETDGWVLVAEGTFDGSGTVYFANADSKYVSTYDTTSVKIVLPEQTGKTVSIAELDVLGVTGDNVDFRTTEGDSETATTLIGTLSADYKYGTESTDVIPEGSLVFTGSYKGNPAYNVVILYDENGEIVGSTDEEGTLTSQQIILADVPDGEDITEVSNGTWIYWIEPEYLENMENPEKVRVELYRVNDALTNEGQRLVSDSLFEEMPAELPGITFGK
ncbi:MAG: M60 family metallopeptidase [Oscillospiraceae bacterium]|nr:M60 family metallopeptidase [Oscillospiraceae bacterium]